MKTELKIIFAITTLILVGTTPLHAADLFTVTGVALDYSGSAHTTAAMASPTSRTCP